MLLFGGGAGVGISAFPSSANTNIIGGLSIFASFGPTVAAGLPMPPWKATYCLPSATYVIAKLPARLLEEYDYVPPLVSRRRIPESLVDLLQRIASIDHRPKLSGLDKTPEKR